jgi:hypothetical protein
MLVFIEFLICLLAVYGGLTLAISMFGAFKRRVAAQSTKVKLVLIVKDVEEYAEYIVRTVIKGEFASKVMSENNITIINMNSSDATGAILSRLQNDYECLDILSGDEKERVFEDL